MNELINRLMNELINKLINDKNELGIKQLTFKPYVMSRGNKFLFY